MKTTRLGLNLPCFASSGRLEQVHARLALHRMQPACPRRRLSRSHRPARTAGTGPGHPSSFQGLYGSSSRLRLDAPSRRHGHACGLVPGSESLASELGAVFEVFYPREDASVWALTRDEQITFFSSRWELQARPPSRSLSHAVLRGPSSQGTMRCDRCALAASCRRNLKCPGSSVGFFCLLTRLSRWRKTCSFLAWCRDFAPARPTFDTNAERGVGGEIGAARGVHLQLAGSSGV